jgi:hypothetical protein
LNNNEDTEKIAADDQMDHQSEDTVSVVEEQPVVVEKKEGVEFVDEQQVNVVESAPVVSEEESRRVETAAILTTRHATEVGQQVESLSSSTDETSSVESDQQVVVNIETQQD